MKRFLAAAALAWFACFMGPAHAGQNQAGQDQAGEDQPGVEHAALVKAVTGVVTIVRQHTRFPATAGSTLRVADRVLTGPGASAAIVFRDGTLLTLGAQADVLVRDYVFAPKEGKFAFALYLAKGSAIYESGKIGKLAAPAVKIDTPKATVGVRGTRFLIEAD